MNTKHQNIETTLCQTFSEGLHRTAHLQRVIAFVLAITIMGVHLCTLTSCQSPADIETPRAVTPSSTTSENSVDANTDASSLTTTLSTGEKLTLSASTTGTRRGSIIISVNGKTPRLHFSSEYTKYPISSSFQYFNGTGTAIDPAVQPIVREVFRMFYYRNQRLELLPLINPGTASMATVIATPDQITPIIVSGGGEIRYALDGYALENNTVSVPLPTDVLLLPEGSIIPRTSDLILNLPPNSASYTHIQLWRQNGTIIINSDGSRGSNFSFTTKDYFAKPGAKTITIPAKDLQQLSPGTITLVISALNITVSNRGDAVLEASTTQEKLVTLQ